MLEKKWKRRKLLHFQGYRYLWVSAMRLPRSFPRIENQVFAMIMSPYQSGRRILGEGGPTPRNLQDEAGPFAVDV